MKKFKVNENCISCGACVSITNSEVFDFNDEMQAEAIEGKNIVEKMDEDTKEKAMDALEGCPVSAIELVECNGDNCDCDDCDCDDCDCEDCDCEDCDCDDCDCE